MLNRFRALIRSPYFLLATFLLSAVSFLCGENAAIICMLVQAQIIAIILLLSDDLFPAFLPTMNIVVLGTTFIGRTELLGPYIPFAVTVIPAFLLHLILYHKRLRTGISFYGIIATAAAILLSGIGNRGGTDYTDPVVIYYLLAMSVGLLLLYCIFAADVKREKGYDPTQYFLLNLCFVGGLCCVVVFGNLIVWIAGTEGSIRVNDYYARFPYRNTIANLLTLCLPAPFYFAGYVMKRLPGYMGTFFCGCLFYAAMLMTTARTALLFGTFVLIASIIYYLRGKTDLYFKLASMFVVLLGAAVLVAAVYEPILELLTSRLGNGLASVGEARFRLLLRSIEDFCEHLIFGIGYAASDNADIYAAEGCISWYHMYFPQIFGGLGIVGCLAYALQGLIRMRLVFYRPNFQTVAVSLCYLGLFLYSQTDPGEFIPIPFAALGVLMFVLLESHYEKGMDAERAEQCETNKKVC